MQGRNILYLEYLGLKTRFSSSKWNRESFWGKWNIRGIQGPLLPLFSSSPKISLFDFPPLSPSQKLANFYFTPFCLCFEHFQNRSFSHFSMQKRRCVFLFMYPSFFYAIGWLSASFISKSSLAIVDFRLGLCALVVWNWILVLLNPRVLFRFQFFFHVLRLLSWNSFIYRW